MKKKFWLWVEVAFLTSVFLSTLVVVVAEAGRMEEGTVWGGSSDEQKPSYSHTSADPLIDFVEWNKTYGGADSDVARSVQQTSEGGYVIAGSTASSGAGEADAWLVKTDEYGSVEWNQTYGGADGDSAVSVQQTSEGGYIFTGSTGSFSADLWGDTWLVKTDAYGSKEWNKTYGGSSWDRASSIDQTSDGGYVIGGYTASFGAGLSDYWLVKTDEYGSVEWNQTYGGSESDRAYAVEQTSDGGYVMVGSANSFKTGGFDGEIWLVKTDADGNVSWSWLSGWPDWDFARSVQQTADGGYVVAGTRFSSYDTRYDFWLIKIDADGSLEWDSVFARAGRNEDVAYSVQQTADGGYIVAGGWGDFWLVKTDGYGSMEWNRSFGGENPEDAYSVRQTNDGGYIAAGSTESFGFGIDAVPDAWVIKFFPSHDVSVNGVEPSKTVVGQGYSLSVNVTVKNPGFFTESINVTAYANATVIGTQTVPSLSPEASTTLTFPWNTTGFSKGNYSISGYALPVLNETKTGDNILVGNLIFVTIPGDVDADRDVDIYDIVAMAMVYGTAKPDPRYSSDCDIDDDGDIDIYDIVIAAGNYAKSW